MGKYRRISYTDRLKIESLYNAGMSCRAIALALGFTPSTICNEVKRALYPHMGAETTKRPMRYSASIAHEISTYNRTSCCMDIKLSHHYEYADYVASEIKKGVSVDVICNTLKKRGKWTVSTTTLYRYIDRAISPMSPMQTCPKRKSLQRLKSVGLPLVPPLVCLSNAAHPLSMTVVPSVIGKWIAL